MILLAAALLQAAPAATVAAVPPKKERRICKETESTGSRLGGARECHTAAEWKAMQGELDGRDVNQMMNVKGINSGATGDGATGKQ